MASRSWHLYQNPPEGEWRQGGRKAELCRVALSGAFLTRLAAILTAGREAGITFGRTEWPVLQWEVGGLHAERTKLENEALRLFEFGIEEEFHARGKIVLDSSLGLMPQARGRDERQHGRPAKKH